MRTGAFNTIFSFVLTGTQCTVMFGSPEFDVPSNSSRPKLSASASSSPIGVVHPGVFVELLGIR